MSKYDPLRDFLRKQAQREIVLTFKQVEDLIGCALPRSAERPQWWANLTDTQTTCVIRCKAATDSDAIRPPIPTEVGHPFRSKPATLVSPA